MWKGAGAARFARLHPSPKGVKPVQQMTPPQGHLFPDKPQQQPAAPRFASNAAPAAQPAQSYEPQARMQQTGSIPVMPKYGTGSLQTLHGTQPVTSMPPMATMPTAQAYQAQQAAQQQSAVTDGTPLMVHTVQGAPVVVTLEEMERAIGEMEQKSGKKQKKQLRGAQKQSGRFVMKFSVLWCVFGVIGVIATALTLWEWAIIPLLVWLHQVTGGAL